MESVFGNQWHRIYWLAATLLAASYVFITSQGYPLAETDSQWFLPPAVSLKNGDGLYNRIHIQSFRYDEKSQRRFVWYTPGFPRTISALMWEPTARCAFMVISAMNAISLLLAAWLFQKLFLWHTPVFDRKSCLWCLAGLLASSTYLVNGRMGRPDYLATLLVMAMAFITLQPRLGAWREILNAALLAWLGFTHPVAALFAFAILGLAYVSLPISRSLLKLTLTGAAGVTLFFLFMHLLGSFGMVENIKGILFHAKITMYEEVRCPNLIKYWIIHTYATGYGILFMVAMIVSVIWICHHTMGLSKKIMAGAFLLFFFLLMRRFVEISWDRTYNLWVFTPIYVAFFLIPIADGWFAGKIRNICHRICGALLLGFSIGYLHTMIIFPYYLSCEKKYDLAHSRIQKLYDTYPGKIAVSKSLWPLVNPSDYSRTLTFSPSDLQIYAGTTSADWIILQERYYFNKRPPNLEGFSLVKDDFSSKPLKLFGLIQLIPSSPAYHWAVYKRN